MQRQITFKCPECKLRITSDVYYTNDYGKTVCAACWDDSKGASRGDVRKRIENTRRGWKKFQLWSALFLALLLSVVFYLEALIYRDVSKQSQSNSVEAGKMYFELKDLREQKKFLELQLWEHTQRWQDLSMYTGTICSYVGTNFDMRFDFAYGGCKPAKKGWTWDLATRDTQDQMLFWYCKAREGHPTAQLPKAQRARLYKEGDTCLLRWQRVMEQKKWHLNYSRNGTQVKVSWERKPIPRPQ